MIKPILFNTDMVRAILEDRKTVTRRVVKPQPEITPIPTFGGSYRISMDKNLFVKPLYRTGDVLYVRETWARSMAGTYLYRATDTPLILDGWRPSIHMPREAARIFLRVTDVRVERLQDITEEQPEAEGVERQDVETINAADVFEFKIPGTRKVCTSARGAFRHLWNSIIKPADRARYGWEANPLVWVIEFERCEKPEGDT